MRSLNPVLVVPATVAIEGTDHHPVCGENRTITPAAAFLDTFANFVAADVDVNQ